MDVVTTGLSADFLKADRLTVNGSDITAYINQKISETASIIYKFKGSVDTYSDLPTSGNINGDVWNVKDTGMNYAWIAETEEWDNLGISIRDISVSLSDVFQVKGTYISSASQISGDLANVFLSSHQPLAGYATENWVEGKGYLTAVHASDISSDLTSEFQAKGNYAYDNMLSDLTVTNETTLEQLREIVSTIITRFGGNK